MLTYLKKDRWSPYVVGVLLDLLSLGSHYLFGKLLGVSATFMRIAVLIQSIFMPGYVATNSYYLDAIGQSWINWQFALIIGLAFGAYIASRLHGPIRYHDVPQLWKKNFGPSKGKRFFGTLFGGILISFGARVAGGCTSGHAISGGMQLAVTSWIFMIAVFAIGIPTAFLLYPKKGS